MSIIRLPVVGPTGLMQCNSEDVALVEASLLKVAGSVAEQDGGFGLLFKGFGSWFQAPNPVGNRDEGRACP